MLIQLGETMLILHFEIFYNIAMSSRNVFSASNEALAAAKRANSYKKILVCKIKSRGE